VEDHAEPLAEIERLLDLADAYRLATEGDNLVGEGEHDEAAARYRRAAELAPGNHELIFWAGLSAAESGDMTTALERVRRAIEMQPGWAELLDRLQPDIAPSAAAVRAALREAG
jgi:Flp pilus assembly protein TadD